MWRPAHLGSLNYMPRMPTFLSLYPTTSFRGSISTAFLCLSEDDNWRQRRKSLRTRLVGYPRGQDGAISPFRDFPLTFMAQACPVKMAEFWPSTACLWAETQTKSINTQKITRPIYSLLVPSDPYQKLSAYSARKFILFSRNCERVSFASCSLNYQGFI